MWTTKETKEGKKLKEKKDLDEIIKKAENGDIEAQEELGKYYLDCWGGTFDNCGTNSEGQKWIDILTENELRRMVANTIHSVKMVENENELKKIESDFG